jgi:hypothetical protein
VFQTPPSSPSSLGSRKSSMCSISSAGSSSGGSTNSPSHQAHLHKQARNSQVLHPLATRSQCVPSARGDPPTHPPTRLTCTSQEQPGTVPTSYQSSMCSISSGGSTNSPSHQAHLHKPGTARYCTHQLLELHVFHQLRGIHQLTLPPGSPAQASQEQPGTVPTSYQSSMCSISSGGSTNSPSHQAHLHKQARNSQVLYPLATRAQCVPLVGGIHQLTLPPGSPAQASQEQPGTVPTSYQSSMCSISSGGSTNSPSHQAHLHKQARNSQVLYPPATRAPCVPSARGDPPTHPPTRLTCTSRPGTARYCTIPTTIAPCIPSVGGIHQLTLPPSSPAQAGQEQPGYCTIQ